MLALPTPLMSLGAWPQFVCWFAAPVPDKPGKFNKFPCDWRTGDVIDAHNPAFWTTAENAIAMASTWDRGHGGGAGFVFTDRDPFFFHDIDHAWDGAAWSPLAIELCGRLAGCAIEVSHSGTGLHVIGRSAPLVHGCKNTPLGLELYTSGRFVALTGTNAAGNCEHDATAPLAAIAAQYFPLVELGDFPGWTTEALPEFTGPTDDDDLIRRAYASGARTAAGTFGGAPTFADLWECNAEVLAIRWPGEGHKPFGQSEADQALAGMLAFWTGKNCDRMERLMRRSGLARDKWDQHRSYLADTILGACAFTKTIFNTPAAFPSAPLVAAVATDVMVEAATATGAKLRNMALEYMGPFDQLAHFAGCYFDNTTEKVYSVKYNRLFSRIAFNINYGGHMFIMDPASQKTTDNAWDAFTQSRVNECRIVDDLCFRPEHAPGEIVRDGTRTYVNSYVPHQVARRKGDAGPFLVHLAKMLPVEEDRDKLLTYLASLAQNPGRKFQWWPVLQGVEGNGKTIVIKAMTHIVGQEYTHLPNAHAMARDGNKFNGWIYRKLFIGIEEICLTGKRDFLDEFKVVVTNDRLPLEKKGQEQFTGDNRCNGILCTNHKDGVPVGVDSRRYAIFYTAQQEPEDLARDGMPETYFANLWDWFFGRNAHAANGPGADFIADYLLSYPLRAELDPAQLSTRAPRTSSTAEALVVSLGRAEQEIMDAVDEGRPGFAGGFVSGRFLAMLLDQIRVHIPPAKRRTMMRALGYTQHPALTAGRTNDAVTPDNAKIILYIRNGHDVLSLIKPVEIGLAYSRAQEAQPVVTGLTPALVFSAAPKAA